MTYLTKSSIPGSGIEAVRRFNRFYTRRIGVLQERRLYHPYSLAEARVLYELAHREAPSAAELGRELGVDAGYLSRILQGFARRRLLTLRRAPGDGRKSLLSLTAAGRKAATGLEARSREQVGAMLDGLPRPAHGRLAGAMQTVQALLSREERKPGIELRAHRPGDMGWVVQRHGVLYNEEYGWDERFEALVAGIVARFIENYDARRERCWIAEIDGEPVGCVFLVKENQATAKLRLLLVEPQARGRGVGRRLVEECMRFARAKGYRKLVLWTQANLTAARNIYKTTGFKRVKQEAHRAFGPRMTGEYWELKL